MNRAVGQFGGAHKAELFAVERGQSDGVLGVPAAALTVGREAAGDMTFNSSWPASPHIATATS
jgi:hypothetical protein